MQVNVQQRRPGIVHGVAKCSLNMLKFIKARTTVDVDNEVGTRITDAVTYNEIVFACITLGDRGGVIRLRCVLARRARWRLDARNGLCGAGNPQLSVCRSARLDR